MADIFYSIMIFASLPKKVLINLSRNYSRLCIVGSGPSAFYTAQFILRNNEFAHVDMYEKLPAPFGLVRYGVAPDHPEVKNVINTFSEVAHNPRFRFMGNVVVGEDVRIVELRSVYSAVILAYGASVDRRLNIPGEDLKGVLSAKDLVGWYNGTPGLSNLLSDLNCETVAIVGMGNVAVDIARILLSPLDRLKSTDIPEPVMATLANSRVRRCVLIGRRAPLQVSFTLKEVRELSRLSCSNAASESCIGIRFSPPDIFERSMGKKEVMDQLIAELPRPRRRLTQFLADLSATSQKLPSSKFCEFVFLRSPQAILTKNEDDDQPRVSGVLLAANVLQGSPSPIQQVSRDTVAPLEELSCGLVVRSIGYRSIQIDPDIPFNHTLGIIQSLDKVGRVSGIDCVTNNSRSTVLCPLYCSGWAKRGAVGVIVDTAVDARTTAQAVLVDLANATTNQQLDSRDGSSAILEMLKHRGVRPLTFSDWERIDSVEKSAGRALGKPREKITSVDDLLKAAFSKAAAHQQKTSTGDGAV